MAPWAFMRVNYIPMTLGIVFSLGLVTCFVTAVLRGDVSPYLPFISETGGKFPEAGIFSIFLYLSSTIGLSTMFVRFLIVDELNRGSDKAIDTLNKASIIIGFIALMGMVIVAAYPMTSIGAVHGIGANVLFIGGVIYAALQTWLSFKMSPYYNGRTICYIRLIITILSALSLITMTILLPFGFRNWSSGSHDHWTGSKMPYDKGIFFLSLPLFFIKHLKARSTSTLEVVSSREVLAIGPSAIRAWNSASHLHWTGSKTPQDKGFGLLVGSSVAEWLMAIFFLAYYFTFIREFGKVFIYLRVQLLVNHFDEEPHEENIVVASERTPIVT